MVSKNNLSNTLNRMFSLHPKLIDFDLTRLRSLMNELNNPHHKLKNVIHIAGTNGKGSTGSFLKEIFEAHNLSVNIYTSPHLIRFNERIRIKNKLISDQTLISILEEIELKNKNKPITFFEITTAAALVAFSRNISDVNILETGLGGRLDATNIIDKKKICIITKIGFDHTEFLGKKIQNIAQEKAGIFRKKIPVVISKQDNKEALNTLKNAASKMNAKIVDLQDIPTNITLGLKGSHQYENASAAFTAAKLIIPSISKTKTIIALKKTCWHARVEQIKTGKIAKYRNNITILDGAHNEDGAAVLNDFLKKQSFLKWNLVIGMLNNKPIESFVKIFKNHINEAFVMAIPNTESSYTPNEICSKLIHMGINSTPVKNIEESLKLADKNMPLLITGSLYLAGHILEYNGTIIK